MADSEVSWKSALTPQKAPTYGNQSMLITSPKELELSNADYVVVFEGTRKYHVTMTEAINPFTLHAIIPEHDTAEEVTVKVFLCQNSNLTILTSLKFTYISQMEHAVAKFLAQSVSDPEVAEKLDVVWTVCFGKDHQEIWDKRLAQAFAQLELPIEWTLVGDILQKDCESQQTLLHFAAHYGLKELINVFLDLPGAKLCLSTCNKSGLMPRDVARENGRLDLVELLDTDRFVENRKRSFSKDSSRRRVLRNADHGITTITNSRNRCVKDDIQLLLELQKLVKVKKNGSPVNRHSWPAKASPFSLENYLDDLENDLAKLNTTGNLINTKPLFLGENILHLRSLTEGLCQFRLQNYQKTSKEISMIADQNRTPMHSRRLSCPASVSRRIKVSQGISKTSPTLPQAAQSYIDTDEDKSTATEPIFSTPPHSPTVKEDVSIAVITPPLDESLDHHEEIAEPCEFMTPLSYTPSSSPIPPTSPIPMSYPTAQKRSHRKDRPNTWYGGLAEISGQDTLSRRSNSLEDFARKLVQNDDTDDESLSEVNVKENLLQTMSLIEDKADRSASFLSSLSDLSVGKDSLGSEVGQEEEGSDGSKDFDKPERIKDGGQKENEEDEEEDEKTREEEDEGHHGDEEEDEGHHGVEEEDEGHRGVEEEKEEREEKERYNENEEEREHVIQDVDVIQELEEHETGQEFEVPCEPLESQHVREEDVTLMCEENGEPQKLGKINDIDNLKQSVVYGDHEGHLKESVVYGDHEGHLKESVVYGDHEGHLKESVVYGDHEGHLKESVVYGDHEGHEIVGGEKEEFLNIDQKNDDYLVKDLAEEDLVEGDLVEEDLVEGDLVGDVVEDDLVEGDLVGDDLGEDLVEGDLVEDDLGEGDLTEEDLVEDLAEEDLVEEDLAEEDHRKPFYFNHMESIDDQTEVLQPKIISSPSKTESEFNNSLITHENTMEKIENYVSEETTTDDGVDPKHIRFDETVSRSRSPDYVDEDVTMDDEPNEFRQRTALLCVSKLPVKRSGSDISVTSLQDVQLDIHSTSKDEDLTPGKLKAGRKAKSYGDVSTLQELRIENKESDEEEHANELRRIAEDQKQLSIKNRIKKFEDVSRSTDKLDQISTSGVVYREDEDPGKRRWSNIFNVKPKKPSRTPTFRREALRSSISSFKTGKSSGKKTAIESLVSGPHGGSFAKHSATAPNLSMLPPRPRATSKNDSSGSLRISPSIGSLDSDDTKTGTESSEEAPAEIVNVPLDLEVDSDLENFDQEPEAWSVTVDRKVLKKMSTKEIKRQDVILELIQTEHHHVRTLKIMQQVFYSGLNKQANYSKDKLDQLFPRINQLVEISSRFYQNLKCRQDEAAAVLKIGDVLVKHFSGDNGIQVKEVYGEFVSKHPEALALYKHYFKTDKKFSNFIKKCHGHRIVRRHSIPECFTLVTQRMTKYPLLIEVIIKATKTSNADHKELQKSLFLVKDALKAVDNAIKDYEKQSILKDIKTRMEKGSVVLKSGQKIKNSRFVDYQSKMVYDGVLMWKNARGRLTETHVVVLESMVAFLQENDKKFSLLSIDGKSPCIPLKSLMVREVATDKNAIYFVSTSKKGPDMYEFVCSSPKLKKQWLLIISEAISVAPEETGDLFQSPEEEKKIAEERIIRRNEILEIMKGKDRELSTLIDDKNKLFIEMKEILQSLDGNGKFNDDEKVLTTEKARFILLSAIHRTTLLAADSIQLLQESHSDSELAAAAHDEKANAPKRAETFGGFDRRPSQKGSRRTTAVIAEGTAVIAEGTAVIAEGTAVIAEGTAEVNHVTQRRDSGFGTTSLANESVASTLNALNQGQDGGPATFIQILDALQLVLLKFTQQETALQLLHAQFQNKEAEIQKLRATKYKNDKSQLLLKEHHQAELTRQKKAYDVLERTFNEQVKEQNVKLKQQQEQHQALLVNFNELRKAFMPNS